jgi:hypothetical protein
VRLHAAHKGRGVVVGQAGRHRLLHLRAGPRRQLLHLRRQQALQLRRQLRPRWLERVRLVQS